MIVVFSTLSDISTNLICSFLIKEKVGFFRINIEDEIRVYQFTIDTNQIELKLIVNNEILNFSDIKTIWYRNGYLFESILKKVIESFPTHKPILKYHDDEIRILNDYFFSVLEEKGMIGNFSMGSPNKLLILKEASKIGFKVPHTIITSEKEVVKSFIVNRKTVMKPIKDAIPIMVGNKIHQPFTKIVDSRFIDTLENTFFPTKFQEAIPIAFELRIFFIESQFFTMAIYSQQRKSKTILDWRYNQVDGNRYVPYKLPMELKIKLKRLLKRVKINSGSIDMIVTPTNEYYFLEINPTGQFNFLSHYTNSYIEKLIARKLKKHEEA